MIIHINDTLFSLLILLPRTIDWFRDTRQSIKGRMPPLLVQAKARQLLQVLRASLVDELGDEFDEKLLPVLSSWWFTRWKREFRVSYRLITQRYKVSYQVFVERLKRTWCNIIRLLRLFALCFPDHPGLPSQRAFDQICRRDLIRIPTLCTSSSIGALSY